MQRGQATFYPFFSKTKETRKSFYLYQHMEEDLSQESGAQMIFQTLKAGNPLRPKDPSRRHALTTGERALADLENEWYDLS
jgi:hypothetical protein